MEMVEVYSFSITAVSKEEKYMQLIPQLLSLVKSEEDFIANLANISAALKESFSWLWVGFYLVKNDTLVLGPFQGTVACTRIKIGKGVCGTCWAKQKSIIVSDVNTFEGHIACSTLSKSEIVIPIINNNGKFLGVLDVDSENLNNFDVCDEKYLTEIVKLIV